MRKTRNSIKCVPVLLLGLVAVAGVCQASDARPMNLLIIQTDEHHFSTLDCYGGKTVGTPNIDWIANHGARCTSFYATTPVCSASRAAFVSGVVSAEDTSRYQ